MHKVRIFATTAALTAAFSLPAMAQQEPALETDGVDVVPLADWDYEGLYAEGWSAENLIDTEVRGVTGDAIGEVENILIGPDNRILSIIAEIGGFIDIGDTHVNVPWDEVEIGPGMEYVRVPVDDDNIGQYTLFGNIEALTAPVAAGEVVAAEVDVATTMRVWRATELIDDYVRLAEGYNYGYVEDLIFDQAGTLQAVVVTPDVGYGIGGPYAYPWYGYRYGYEPGLDYYELPYGRDEIAGMEPFEYGELGDGTVVE